MDWDCALCAAKWSDCEGEGLVGSLGSLAVMKLFEFYNRAQHINTADEKKTSTKYISAHFVESFHAFEWVFRFIHSPLYLIIFFGILLLEEFSCAPLPVRQSRAISCQCLGQSYKGMSELILIKCSSTFQRKCCDVVGRYPLSIFSRLCYDHHHWTNRNPIH